MIGQTLSHYRITAKLGEGGMGEVYRAEDTTLKRQVALKILPSELAGSQERLERFQREAETLAALDHPNIVTIHSIEAADNVRFLTMQLVEGQRLSELIPRGGMALNRIFDITIPLADALAAAHEKGVVHRDLKPGNVMVADDGRVKVLDFGLAKLRHESAEVGATELPTEPLTDEGRVLGTVPYMSPEQVEGKPLDHRSDLFSLGVMLYEMATGRRPFQGESPASTMSAILRDTPSSVIDLNAALPRDLAKIIRRCLVKQPERRFQTARELAIELGELQSEVESGEAWSPAAPPTRRRTAVLWGAVAAAGIVSATIASVMWILRSGEDTVEERRSTESATLTQLVFGADEKGKVSASPDGRFFVYASDASGNWDIYLRRIAGGNAINLTEDSVDDDHQPAFSPDGELIAFRSERQGGGIFVMGATGESIRRLTERGFFPAWSPDGTKIAYSTSPRPYLFGGDLDQRTWIVDLSAGEERLVLDSSMMDPAWSPSGEWIAYRAASGTSENSWQQDLFVVRVNGSEPRAITDDAHNERVPTWSPSGRSLYYVSDRGGSSDLWRVRINERSGRKLGEPERMTSGSSVVHVSPSGDGSQILYSTTDWHREILRLPFDPVGEKLDGPPVSITPPGLQPAFPAVSADGGWIAFSAIFGHYGSFAIGVVRKDGSGLRQVTESGHRDFYPDWSPDGQRLAFRSNRSGNFQAWIVKTDGGGLWHLTDTPGASVIWPKWSPDGSQLALCNIEKGQVGAYISGTSKPWSEEPPVQLPPPGGPDEFFCPWSWSPDGQLLAGTIGRVSLDGAAERRIALYSFDSRSYRVLTETFVTDRVFDQNPQWLEDGVRLFVGREDGVFYILDTQTGEQREVFSIESLGIEHDGPLLMARLSPDNRDIYFYSRHRESAIWMMTLGEQE